MSDDADLTTSSAIEPPPLPMSDEVAKPVGRIDLAKLDEMSRADPALFERNHQDPPFARQVMTTPLHFYVASESLTNLWRNWNGYSVATI